MNFLRELNLEKFVDFENELHVWFNDFEAESKIKPLLLLGDPENMIKFVIKMIPQEIIFYIKENIFEFSLFDPNNHKLEFAENFKFNEKSLIFVHKFLNSIEHV